MSYMGSHAAKAGGSVGGDVSDKVCDEVWDKVFEPLSPAEAGLVAASKVLDPPSQCSGGASPPSPAEAGFVAAREAEEEADTEFAEEDEDEDSRFGGGGSRVWHRGHLGVGRVPVEVSSGRAQRHLGQYSTRVPGGRSAEPHLRQ